MIESVFGPPIRPFRYSRRQTNPVGISLTLRSPTETALIALWDDPHGLFIYDYEQFTLFQASEAEETRARAIESLCKCPETLFLGYSRIADGSSVLKFDDIERTGAVGLLR